MRRITIKRYSDLTDDQWRRLATSIRREARQITGRSCDIGIGRKYTAGRPYGWQIAARVYLPEKRERVAEDKCLPSHFVVRLRRPDGKYDQIRIRSDVEQRSDYVPTSAAIRLGSRNAASGFLVRWEDRDGAKQWGFATVAHLLEGTRRRVASVRVNSATQFQCRLHRSSAERSGFDFAVFKIVGAPASVEQQLKRCDLIQRTNQAAIRFMATDQVIKAATRHRRGKSFFPGGDAGFTGEEVFPNGFTLGNRKLDDCIRVGRAAEGTFGEGRSGSFWQLGGEPACVQVGGKVPDFREGIGQPMDRFVAWIRETLGERANVVAVLDGRIG